MRAINSTSYIASPLLLCISVSVFHYCTHIYHYLLRCVIGSEISQSKWLQTYTRFIAACRRASPRTYLVLCRFDSFKKICIFHLFFMNYYRSENAFRTKLLEEVYQILSLPLLSFISQPTVHLLPMTSIWTRWVMCYFIQHLPHACQLSPILVLRKNLLSNEWIFYPVPFLLIL